MKKFYLKSFLVIFGALLGVSVSSYSLAAESADRGGNIRPGRAISASAMRQLHADCDHLADSCGSGGIEWKGKPPSAGAPISAGHLNQVKDFLLSSFVKLPAADRSALNALQIRRGGPIRASDMLMLQRAAANAGCSCNRNRVCDAGETHTGCPADCYCGNGTVEPDDGEQCEPKNTPTCDSNCQMIPSCKCDEWATGLCSSAGGCADGQMHQTRTCTPAGCLPQSRCADDRVCCVSDGSCNAVDPDCGMTSYGTDNCGESCYKTGPACRSRVEVVQETH